MEGGLPPTFGSHEAPHLPFHLLAWRRFHAGKRFRQTTDMTATGENERLPTISEIFEDRHYP